MWTGEKGGNKNCAALKENSFKNCTANDKTLMRVTKLYCKLQDFIVNEQKCYFLLIASSTATATVTVAPTIGLFPIPMKPIISTWAGTEEEPAN
jgi:hypothetical protein